MIAHHTTIEQFFTALAEVDRVWWFNGKVIRCQQSGDPITETAKASSLGSYPDCTHWERAADDLGLDEVEAGELMHAIDGQIEDNPTRLRLRARLIEVCEPRK